MYLNIEREELVVKEEMKVKEYEKHYSEKRLLDKLMKYAKVAGINVVYLGLLLFYSLSNPELPAKLKGVVMGALGYFILPIDLIADITPIVGYSDDLGILMGALVMIAFYINDEIKDKAKTKLKDLFGEYDEELLKEINKKINESQ